jgi:hypothetical protein
MDGSFNGTTQNTACAASSPTTLTGLVAIPAGTLPLYNAKVYIAQTPAPDDPAAPTNLPPIAHGATCDTCDKIVPPDAVASGVTDINGKFTLTNVPFPPDGKAMYLVVRVGKWRRYVRIENNNSTNPGAAKITHCGSTTLDQNATRLPRTQAEGDIPKIALSTGSADALECILRGPKLGLADSEFTTDSGSGSVNLYAGNGTNQFDTALGGAKFTAAQNTPTPSWWDTQANWNKYDIVMLSCEGDPNYATKSVTARANLPTYINAGGRVFASHWHNGWIEQGPMPLSTVATFVQKPTNPSLGTIDEDIITSFQKGANLKQWLGNAQALTAKGQLHVEGAKNTVLTLNTKIAQQWVTVLDTANNQTVNQYFSFYAPIGTPAASQCGEMVFTDLHVSSGVGDTSAGGTATAFPLGCKTTTLSPQEEALIFLFFDLTNCVQPSPIG